MSILTYFVLPAILFPSSSVPKQACKSDIVGDMENGNWLQTAEDTVHALFFTVHMGNFRSI